MSNQTTGPSNRKLRDIQKELDELISSSHLVTNAEEIEALERKIREVTDSLAACILEQKTQESLDSDEMEELEKEYIKNHPKRMKRIMDPQKAQTMGQGTTFFAPTGQSRASHSKYHSPLQRPL